MPGFLKCFTTTILPPQRIIKHFDLFMIMKLFVLFTEKENMEYENFSNDLDKIDK